MRCSQQWTAVAVNGQFSRGPKGSERVGQSNQFRQSKFFAWKRICQGECRSSLQKAEPTPTDKPAEELVTPAEPTEAVTVESPAAETPRPAETRPTPVPLSVRSDRDDSNHNLLSMLLFLCCMILSFLLLRRLFLTFGANRSFPPPSSDPFHDDFWTNLLSSSVLEMNKHTFSSGSHVPMHTHAPIAQSNHTFVVNRRSFFFFCSTLGDIRCFDFQLIVQLYTNAESSSSFPFCWNKNNNFAFLHEQIFSWASIETDLFVEGECKICVVDRFESNGWQICLTFRSNMPAKEAREDRKKGKDSGRKEWQDTLSRNNYFEEKDLCIFNVAFSPHEMRKQKKKKEGRKPKVIVITFRWFTIDWR